MIVSPEDKDVINSHKWYFDDHTGYWRRTSDGMTLHDVLLGKAPVGFVWDHVDRDRTNNSRSNLRLATYSQSQANRAKIADKKFTSGYKGVYLHRRKKWVAQIRIDGITRYLGSFDIEKDAALRYDKEARKLFGEFALTNF
jgi:hypothetical protein